MKKVFCAAVLIAGAAGAGCSKALVLTESQEYYVGRGLAANAIAQHSLITDGKLEEYVNMVGLSVAMESDRPETFLGYYFGVLNTDKVNAFAAPSGFVFVTVGALRLMESEDELAGVLAHEIAHLNLHHPEEYAAKESDRAGAADFLDYGSTGLSLGGFALGKAGVKVPEGVGRVTQLAPIFSGLLDKALDEILVNGYGRASELAADALAVDLVSRKGVGYDPRALSAFLARMKTKQSESGVWSGSHPDLGARAEEVQAAIKKLNRPVAAVDPARTARFKAALAGIKGP